MAGVLLRSGSVKHFLPLGAIGSPVYSAASQLRAAIRRHLGTEMADYFAIPQQDEKGETIDWYSAFDGSVVPWSAATPEERSLAKGGLLAAQRQLRERSRTLQASEDSEQQVFGKLLELATRIPSDEHVYLVDGRPVMTFWGFAERDGPTDLDVLAGLDTSSIAGANDAAWLSAASAAGSATRGCWWSWPWLLLPLLLLLLLLAWGLRGCFPDGVPRIDVTWPAPVDKDGERTSDRSGNGTDGVPHEKDDPSRPVQDKQADEATREVDERNARGRTDYETTYRGSGDSRIDRTYDGSDGTRVDTERNDADTERDDMAVDRSDTTATDDKSVSDTTDDARTDDSGTADTRDTAADAGKADGTDERDGDGDGDGRDEDKNTGAMEASGTDTGTDDKSKGKEDGKTTAERSRDAETQRATRTTRGAGAPLEIPRDAARKGSTDFLNGGWRSVTGLQDAAGNPVQLEYDFKGGEGTAKLRRTVNGKEQTCSAAVRSTFQGSRLVIDQADDIRCPDGSTFQRSSVECTTNAQGRAECKGKNRDGSDFQVRISKK